LIAELSLSNCTSGLLEGKDFCRLQQI